MEKELEKMTLEISKPKSKIMLAQEVSLKFFFQQLLDTGDLIGTLIIFGILRWLDEGDIGELTTEHSWLFVYEVAAEFLIEILWMLTMIPTIRRMTVLKEFRPSAGAKDNLSKDIVYLSLLSIMTYPMMLFMILKP